MLTIAIVEDDEGYSKLLQRFVKKYGEETGETFRISAFPDGLSFLADYDAGYNVVFMDIEMPFLDGLKTSRKLRAIDQNASLIFVTNMAKYAVSGYEVDAMDFIVKPVDYFNFSLKFEKAVRIQKKRASSIVIVSTEDGMVRLNASDIMFVESCLHFVIYHTDKGDMRARASMKDTEKKFAGMNFVRCNNSFLVNLARVDKVTADAVTIGEHELAVSRSKKKPFLDALALFYGGLQ